MNHKRKNERYGRLTVVGYGEKRGPRYQWLCKCDCGNIVSIDPRSLIGKLTQSCGCLWKERITTHGHTRDISGRKTRVYACWQGMKQRCYNPNNRGFKNYGGRGIKVCQHWLDSFENFFADMGEPPNNIRKTVERKNNDGDYEPQNCYWATLKEQQKNKRARNKEELRIAALRRTRSKNGRFV